MRGFKGVVGFVAAMVCLLATLGACGTAFAAPQFPFDGQIAPAGGSFGTLEAGSVAVNDSNGDTYVADSASGVVDVFETVSGSQLAGLDGSLTPAGSFGGGQVEVAANNGTGDVYVLDSTDNVVDVFSSAGGYVCQITGSATPSASECNGVAGSDTPAHGFSTPGGIAVDQATGNVYVVDAHNGAVDVFSAAGAYLRQISLASIEGGFNATYTRGIAVDDFNGEVFVSDSGSPNPAGEDVVYVFNAAGEYQTAWTGIPGQAFGGGFISVAADDASGEVFVTSTVHGATDVFEPSGGYITQFSHSFNSPQGTAVDQGTHKVYVSDEGVVDIFGPLLVGPPTVDEESSANVTQTSAYIQAQIDPKAHDTRFHFEYGPSTAYGSSAPVPDADIGSGAVDVAQSVLVEGLSPGTNYHYRAVATSSLGTTNGPDHVFTTQSASAPVLPDGRAWEMVSPPDKRGVALEPIGALRGAEIQAAANGDGITYAAAGPIGAEPKGNRSIAYTQVLSKRTAGGWSAQDITTPNEVVTGTGGLSFSEYRLFSPDLSVGLLDSEGNTPLSPQTTERTPYLREADGEYTPLVTAANVPPGVKFGQNPGGRENEGAVEFAGATADLRHIVVESAVPLTQGIAYSEGSTVRNLFEWYGGSLRLVSVLPNGKAATEEGQSSLLGLVVGKGANVRHAISEDGSRVFWEASGNASALYLRDVSRGETVRLDTVQAGALGGAGEARFLVASSDGSRVFFKDESRLTPDSHAGLGKADLYMCEVGEVAGKLACRLKDLTVDLNAGESADMLGTAIGASEDGRYVYFVANGVLAAGASPGDCPADEPRSAPDTMCNLYVYDTVVGETRFISQLAASDFQDWYAYHGGLLYYLTAGVSPDGRYLAFMSEKSLTGYDNIDVRSGQPDVEVFLYDTGTGHLMCASCNPSGARPSGVLDSEEGQGLLVDRPKNWAGYGLAGSIPGWTAVGEYGRYRSRYLSDGGRLFFDSADALVPGDTNGKEDVYGFEPAGVGSCTSASVGFSERAGGCVGLISSGTSSEESAFLDASESGDDVFFLTAAQLVPRDLDNEMDVYDARVCSASSPCLVGASSVQPPPCATADSCRAAPAPQPDLFGAPPSATFSGTGNPGPAVSKPVAKRTVSVARKRAAALRRCRTKPKRRRVSCEALARRRYPVGVKAKRSVRSSTRKGSR